VTAGDGRASKAAGNANNDWVGTRLPEPGDGRARGEPAAGPAAARCPTDTSLEAVTERFQRIYHERRHLETLIPERSLLERIAAAPPLAVVTGRPRDEADQFLREHASRDLVRVVVCMDDAPAKPSPEPVRLALRLLLLAFLCCLCCSVWLLLLFPLLPPLQLGRAHV